MKFALIILAVVSAAMAVPLGGPSSAQSNVAFVVSIRDAMRYTAHVAGGSIINSRFVLTNAWPLTWSWSLPRHFTAEANVETSWGRSVDSYIAERIIIHPNFVRETNQNDIALLQTRNDIIFHARVQPIALSHLILTNQDAVFAGFGFVEETETIDTPLVSVEFRAISNAECRTILGAENAALLFDTKGCVLPSDNRVVCGNDNGAPLIINNQVIAVSSWNVPCAHNSPIIVERVGAHWDFIQGNIA